jgi:hypothetical protein
MGLGCCALILQAIAQNGKKGMNGGAGEGNRTLVVSLEGFCSTIELHPHVVAKPMAKNSAGGKRLASASEAEGDDDHDKQAKHCHRDHG